jgi:hypothetical protein
MLSPEEVAHLGFTPASAVRAVAAYELNLGPEPGRIVQIPQSQLLEWANKWEPEASASPPAYRKASCVQCGEPMVEMWHLWLSDGGFKKEVHLCRTCGEEWETNG